MGEGCPFCSIPEREHTYYNDELVYLVKTKDMKGHEHRVTVATHRHTTEPSFEELTKSYCVLYDYMNGLELKEWYIVDRTFCRFPDHWHLVACGNKGTQEELHLLAKTPKVKYPLNPMSYYPGKVMIGIPAHNEEENIGEVAKVAGKYGDVVVYNDRSTDKTEDEALHSGAQIILDQKGAGYGYGLKSLMGYARDRYDALITLDGDGQHNPDEIPRFLGALRESDVVLGNRFIGKTDIPKRREAVIKTINKAYNVGDAQCGFRAYNKTALEKIEINDHGFGASLEILNRIADHDLKVAEVPCTIVYGDTEHTEPPMKHGMNLLESLFWGTIWRRPYSYIGIPCFVLFLLSLFFGANLVHYYRRSGYFVVSYGILMVGFLITSLALGIATFFVTVQRRLLRELK